MKGNGLFSYDLSYENQYDHRMSTSHGKLLSSHQSSRLFRALPGSEPESAKLRQEPKKRRARPPSEGPCRRSDRVQSLPQKKYFSEDEVAESGNSGTSSDEEPRKEGKKRREADYSPEGSEENNDLSDSESADESSCDEENCGDKRRRRIPKQDSRGTGVEADDLKQALARSIADYESVLQRTRTQDDNDLQQALALSLTGAGASRAKALGEAAPAVSPPHLPSEAASGRQKRKGASGLGKADADPNGRKGKSGKKIRRSKPVDKTKAPSREDIMYAYKNYDRDDRGFITASDMFRESRTMGYSRWTYTQCEEMVLVFATNKQGMTFQDFSALILEQGAF
ncbi:hypothetical protein CYMTET_35079 [Cymbomonas tetramitiformis]|uniref:EF-hand domain-containing protein n=1 Tax=Cymbomonas tetramitiformis TaxID=36881 RepID=A0AAE0FAC7_9CHLO|nr:hypothetical protein CYMTET_35079 [Cymbomonas tetramitiformis]